MKVELLAPAGSYEALEAAFEAGADAVYLGGQKFGARAYADNLDQEQLIRAIDLAHLKGKQLYLTINTLLKNRELETELYEYLAPLYEAGLDAVIVQDPGVMDFVKTYFPGLHIHASTQMTITGVESAKLLQKAGATRVVTARELSLEEIKKIYDATHMEIESFVHGALCYCYSGQCLMSSMIGGRSGNRGRCAQPCRLPYQVYRDGKRLNNDRTGYALSPKDMCTVDILPEIIEAGVYSLKIEGRMKKPEYTAGVVSVYRKYLDKYLSGEKRPIVTKEDKQMLWDIYNRDGFHQSYYKQRNGRSMMALENEKSAGIIRNEELFTRIRKEYMDKKTPVLIRGTMSLYNGCPAILEVQAGDCRVTVEGESVQSAMNCPLGEERIRRQMEKTGGSGFMFEKLDIFMGDDIFLPMQQLNHLRRQGLEALEEEMLRPWKQRKAKEQDLKDIPKNRQPRSFSQLLWRQKNSLQQWKRQMELRESMRTVESFRCLVLFRMWKDGFTDWKKRGKNCFLHCRESFETGNLMEGKRLFKNWFRKVLEAFWCGIWKAMESWMRWDLPTGSFWMRIFIQ